MENLPIIAVSVVIVLGLVGEVTRVLVKGQRDSRPLPITKE